MPVTDQPHPSEVRREEGFLHYVAREGRVFLRWTIVVCMIAIVLCMISPGFYFLAVIPALVLLAAYVLLVATSEVERRSDTVAHREFERAETAMETDVMEDHAEDDQLRPKDARIVKRESKTGAAIVIAVLLAATLIALIIFDQKMLAIGAFVLFAYMLFIAAPLWLGWFNDDVEEQSQKAEPAEDATTP